MAILALPHALDASVDRLKDVGPRYSKLLAKLGIETVRDLLLTLPFRCDTFAPSPIANLVPGAQASVVGTIVSIKPSVTQRRKIRLVEAFVADDSGAEMRVVWFHSNFVLKQLHQGDRVMFAGVVEKNPYRGRPGMVNPQHERLNGSGSPQKLREMTPRYHVVAGLTSRKVAEWVESAMPLAAQVDDVLPDDVRERNRLLPVADAIRQGHQPDTLDDFNAARKRMAFAELFELQTAFAVMRAGIATEPATPIPYRQEVIDTFKAGLGFELTRAQRKATWETFQDMEKAVPMNRLLDGDVGSGKTAVAAACAAMAHASGLPECRGTPAGPHGRRLRPLRAGRRHACSHRGRGPAREPGPCRGRRAAPIRDQAARAPTGKGRRAPALPRHDRDPHPTHPRPRELRRDDALGDR